MRVSASGGMPTAVTSLSFNENESSHRWPYFLPDGRHFLYLSLRGLSARDNPTEHDSNRLVGLKRTQDPIHL